MGNATSDHNMCPRQKVAPAHCCNHCQHVAYWECIGEWYLVSQNVSELSSTVVSLPIVNALGNAISGHDMCPRQEQLQRSVEIHCQDVTKMGIRWGMLSLATKCGRGKSSSSACCLHSRCNPMKCGGNATSTHGICPRQSGSSAVFIFILGKSVQQYYL